MRGERVRGGVRSLAMARCAASRFSLIFTCFGSIVSFLALSMCELAGVFVCFVTRGAKVLLACWGEQSASSSLALTLSSQKDHESY